jgi:hypothetical protein
MRERGNIWPIISVIAVAILVLVLPLVIRHMQTSSRMATVDAQVSISDTGTDLTQIRESPTYRWPDSEVPRTAERLRDVTATAIAASTYVAQAAMSGHIPFDVDEVATSIATRKLIPSEWLTDQSGVLQTAHGTLHVRYAPSSLSIEVVSVPASHADGPGILIRIPDDENIMVGPRYFESMRVDGIIYPSPFAPISEVIASGWRNRFFKQTN